VAYYARCDSDDRRAERIENSVLPDWVDHRIQVVDVREILHAVHRGVPHERMALMWISECRTVHRTQMIGG
jgi:hypothetical protein